MSAEIDFKGLSPQEARESIKVYAAPEGAKINYNKLATNLICTECSKVYSLSDAATWCAALDKTIGL